MLWMVSATGADLAAPELQRRASAAGFSAAGFTKDSTEPEAAQLRRRPPAPEPEPASAGRMQSAGGAGGAGGAGSNGGCEVRGPTSSMSGYAQPEPEPEPEPESEYATSEHASPDMIRSASELKEFEKAAEQVSYVFRTLR